MSAQPLIVWFRQDLRLADNPALHAACKTGVPIIPVYILDDKNAGPWKMGGAARVWLHHSLSALDKSLSGHLHIECGDAADIIPALIKKTKAQGVYWNRCYEPWRIARDKKIKADLEEGDLIAESFNGSLLWEPWEVKKTDGTPYKVFTPFFRKGCMSAAEPRQPLPAPKKIDYASVPKGMSIDDLKLLPTKPRWDTPMLKNWTIGEKGAQTRLKDFMDDGLKGYKEGRNVPAQNNTSRLSPHLHFGEISPNTAWYAVQSYGPAHHLERDTDTFQFELGWREFSYSLLYYTPTIVWENLNKKFDDFPWNGRETKAVNAWQRGMTGYPIVDAGMRELWQTGYMHNRVRMVVGSFLVKHMLTHWRQGEIWFWDTLFDADLANNSASWQWIAGCGADAAPYFRIFNPMTQGEKFDPKGDYVRQYVPEIAALPDKYIHKPWEAPDMVLEQAGVTLGKTYPKPIVEHSEAREKALEAFQNTR